MARRKQSWQGAKRLVGIYLCHACGKQVEREAAEGQPLKKWRKSYCERTGKDARIWLKQQRHLPPNACRVAPDPE